MGDKASLHGALDGAGEKTVAVGLAGRLKTGVEPLLPFICLKDAYLPREQGVEPFYQLVAGNGARGAKVSAHAQRVDTGIGPAGAMERCRTVADDRKRLLNIRLYGRPAALPLPAAIACSIIGYEQSYGSHRWAWQSAFRETAAPEPNRWFRENHTSGSCSGRPVPRPP